MSTTFRLIVHKADMINIGNDYWIRPFIITNRYIELAAKMYLR